MRHRSELTKDMVDQGIAKAEAINTEYRTEEGKVVLCPNNSAGVNLLNKCLAPIVDEG